MTSGTRNPYVILGIPFGATRDQAARAFARRAKGQRRAREATERLTELTWALNQVQDAIADPRTALHVYRVPADAVALEPQGDGILRPRPELMARKTHDEDSRRAIGAMLDSARSEALHAVHAEAAASVQLPPR
jgi:hypothetical protein